MEPDKKKRILKGAKQIGLFLLNKIPIFAPLKNFIPTRSNMVTAIQYQGKTKEELLEFMLEFKFSLPETMTYDDIKSGDFFVANGGETKVYSKSAFKQAYI